MAHRRVTRGSGNGGETRLDKARLLQAERKLFRLHVKLGQRHSRRGPLRNFPAQPGQEIHPCRTVLVMTFTIARQLHRVFRSFHQGDRVGLPDNFPLRFNRKA